MKIASDGIYKGRRAGVARKAGTCDETNCTNMIQIGDMFIYGDTSLSKAGGFGQERYCMACAECTAVEVKPSSLPSPGGDNSYVPYDIHRVMAGGC